MTTHFLITTVSLNSPCGFGRKVRGSSEALAFSEVRGNDAIRRAKNGLIDANLGGGVIKQRIARKGGGRSRGYRTIVLFRRGELAFLVYGFAKSSQANLRRSELEAYRLLANKYLALDQSGLAAAQAVGAIIEVKCDEKAVQE